MPLKVTKKGKAYAIVKDGTPGKSWLDMWYVVDVKSGTKVKSCWTAESAKWNLEQLEGGHKTVDQFAHSVGFGEPMDMPDSLKKMQQGLLNPKAKKVKAAKPIGANATVIRGVEDKGPFKVLKMADGTFGIFVPSTGASKFGLASLRGASRSGWAEARKMAGAKLSAMGVDPGSDAVDTLLGVYEGRMRDMYAQAAKEMAEKQAKHLKKFEEQKSVMLGKLKDGQITDAQYKDWLKGQAGRSQWYSDMVDGLSADLVDADKKAMDMLNGYVPGAFADNMNFATYQLEKQAGMSTGFTLYNEKTVARLVEMPDAPLLPEPKIDIQKDMQWSKQKISSSVAQSILQGESVTAAAARLEAVVGICASSAMRAARTALTGAQNMGRLEAGKRAKAMGIELKKQWIATVDSRTRHSHRQLDRETVELEESFSNGCAFPGDPDGTGSEVYNCRCAMRYVLPGHEYDDLPEVSREGLSYDEWKNEHLLQEQAQKDKLEAQIQAFEAEEAKIKAALPENKTYDGIWKNSVTYDDYEAKKGSIAAKEDYYHQQILNAPSGPGGDVIVQASKNNLLKLAEFNEKGKEYTEAKQAVEEQLGAIAEKKKEAKAKLAKLSGKEAYSEQRKANAIKLNSISESRRVFGPRADELWRDATERERDGIYSYTSGSGGHNRPLAGFKKPWSEGGSGWEERYYVGPNNVSIDYEGRGDRIRAMTDLISRSTYEEDIWLQRGCDYNDIESLLGLRQGDLSRMTNDELQQFVGYSGRRESFTSCGAAVGTGFASKPVTCMVYAPRGSQMMYIDEYSAYQGENEMILQRGASVTITKIEKNGYGRLDVELEHHPEDGYHLFQQDPDEWKGPKESYR